MVGRALACPSWQDSDSHGSSSSGFISSEAGSSASCCLNATRATGGEGALHTQLHTIQPFCLLPARHIPVPGSSRPKTCFPQASIWEIFCLPLGALGRSFVVASAASPLARWLAMGCGCTQDLLSQGQSTLSSQHCPWLHIGAGPWESPQAGWSHWLELLQCWHLHRVLCKTSVVETAGSQQKRWVKRKGKDGKPICFSLPIPSSFPTALCSYLASQGGQGGTVVALPGSLRRHRHHQMVWFGRNL